MQDACIDWANPNHLFLGTAKDNMIDMSQKGRGNAGWTQCAHGHELTPENTLWIKHKDGKVQRRCRRCAYDRQREYRQRQRK